MRKGIVLILLLALCSCKNYYITVESLKNQLSNTHYEKTIVDSPFPIFSGIKYEANRLDSLEVSDRKGEVTYLHNGPSIEMRFTKKSGKREVFYFDTVKILKDTVYGCTSRFLQRERKISLQDVIKIEVQDGKKGFAERKKS